jgi:hypothetical protein
MIQVRISTISELLLEKGRDCWPSPANIARERGHVALEPSAGTFHHEGGETSSNHGRPEMKKQSRKLTLHRETVSILSQGDLRVAAGGTLTYEGSCENSYCPCPTQTQGLDNGSR